MTPKQFKQYRLALDLTQRKLGLLLGYGPNTAKTAVNKLEAGRQAITLPIAQMMKGLER